MNGGRKKWELEKRALVTDRPSLSRAATIPIPATDESIRAYREEVVETLRQTAKSIWSMSARPMNSPAK